MNSGEIFLGDIIKTEDYRHQINRAGLQNIVPNWWVKEIIPDSTNLPLIAGDLILTPTISPELAGKEITVTSTEPVQHSHLEMYPQWSHYWRQAGTYLRGYLVNQTDEAYQRLRVQFVFYRADNKIEYETETEIFLVYGQTMKPFIINTRSINWRNVDRIEIRPIASVAMRR